jgi:hypothetical protein
MVDNSKRKVVSSYNLLLQLSLPINSRRFTATVPTRPKKKIHQELSQPCVLSFISFVDDANLPLVKLNVGHSPRMCYQCKMEPCTNGLATFLAEHILGRHCVGNANNITQRDGS